MGIDVDCSCVNVLASTHRIGSKYAQITQIELCFARPYILALNSQKRHLVYQRAKLNCSLDRQDIACL